MDIKNKIMGQAKFQSYQSQKGFPKFQKSIIQCQECDEKFIVSMKVWHYNPKRIYNVKQKKTTCYCPYCHKFKVVFFKIDLKNKIYVDNQIEVLTLEDAMYEK